MPSCKSPQVNPISSEMRSPVCAAVKSSAWSRRPAQVVRSGLASGALLRQGRGSDESPLGAFGGDREHALDQAGVLGMPERAVLEGRMDRGQADVARARAVAPPGLEMLEEGADQRRVEV